MKLKKTVILSSTLIFTLGIISVGYGYWTDRLDFEGSADVKMELNVIDDIVDETPSPTAIEISEELILNTGDSDKPSSENSLQDEVKSEDQQGTVDENGIDTNNENSEVTNTDSDNGNSNEGSDNSQTDSIQQTVQNSDDGNNVNQETVDKIEPLSESEQPAVEGSGDNIDSLDESGL